MSDTSSNSLPELNVYETRHFFRGRQIDPETLPPENITESFLDGLVGPMIHRGFEDDSLELKRHSCDSRCAIETFIVMGKPYTKNLREAVDW